MPGHRSTALPLAGLFVALVVYASLYPFEGWRWPPGLDAIDLLHLPWSPWRHRFDEWSNVLGYVPLGALVFGVMVRSGMRAKAAAALTLLAAAMLSYSLEVAQYFVPGRVPSSRDLLGNAFGAALGVALGAALLGLGWVDRWHGLRLRWFARESAAALGLLLLWPLALVFPAPVPLGLGAVWGEAAQWIGAALAGTPWEADVRAWLEVTSVAQRPLSRAGEAVVTALGLFGPCLVAFATARKGIHRVVLVIGALALAVGVSALSTALNFGPEHALAWWSPATPHALAIGALLSIAMVGAGVRAAAGVGLLALAVSVVLVAHAPPDPYYAANLQGWEQGRFIRFHGLAQWIGWLWPYAAMAWLLVRLSRREEA